jgi:glycine C-acetyltransferase
LATKARQGARRIITGPYQPGRAWPRYRLQGSDGEYLRMNANSYLSLSHHPTVLHAADEAAGVFGAGPGAVRFIDGTSVHHVALESRIAAFTGRPAAKAFNSAYTTVLGTAITLTGPDTFWTGERCPHCIIRACGSRTSRATAVRSSPTTT